jgi:hypothetical protein
MTGRLGVGSTVSIPATNGVIAASNDIIAFSTSDERLKANLTLLTEPLFKLSQLNGYEFDWIPMIGIHEHKGHDIGISAQEAMKVIPEIVTTRDNGYMAVKYEKIVPLLIEAIKELSGQVKDLQEKLKDKE